MNLLLTRLVVRRLLRRRATGTIPRSGPEVKALDCYTVWVTWGDGRWKAVCLEALDQGVVAKLLDGGSFSIDLCIPYETLASETVEIRHWYGPYTLDYKSLRQYVLEAWSGYDYVQVTLERLRQAAFNSRPIVRLDLMALLQELVRLTRADPGFKTDPTFLVSELSSMRVFSHPRFGEATQHYRLLFDALVHSDDLRKLGGDYSITPKALWTVAQFEVEERRHRDSKRGAGRMLLLTLALIGVGAVQAYVSWCGSCSR